MERPNSLLPKIQTHVNAAFVGATGLLAPTFARIPACFMKVFPFLMVDSWNPAGLLPQRNAGSFTGGF